MYLIKLQNNLQYNITILGDHNCDASFVPDNLTSQSKYFAVIACYEQCYDILEPAEPSYSAKDA